MNPDALFVADALGCTPFDFAIRSVNEWAIEHFQCKFSIWSVAEAFVRGMQRWSQTRTIDQVKALQRREQRFREGAGRVCASSVVIVATRLCASDLRLLVHLG